MLKYAGIFMLVAITADGVCQAGSILKTEPPMGALREGEIVLVDDGSCPKGQIKQVIGGNHVKAGGYKNIVRTRSCIARPD
jgi:hypothetical protein